MRLLREMTSGMIISLDNMNDYYDVSLKKYRLGLVEEAAKKSSVKHVFVEGSIADKALVDKLFEEYKPAVIVNLAAQAGVRYSIDHPDVYIESNLIGFYNILEACRNNPVSLYAATKKSNELLAHAYSKLYNIVEILQLNQVFHLAMKRTA